MRWAVIAALGWLLLPAGANAQSGPAGTELQYARASAFSYRPSDGLLETETVEPDRADQCVVTTHAYDDWGNKASATTANCPGATGYAPFETRVATQAWSRTTMPTFTVGSKVLALQPGHFPLDVTNALGQVQSQLFDPRFGVPVEVKAPNGLTTKAVYDELGRKTSETKPDGTGTVTQYCILSNRGLDQTTNTEGCNNPAHAPADAVQYVKSWPVNTLGGKIGPWTWSYSDRQGRTLRVATEGFNGDEQPANLKGAVVVRDVVYNVAGAKVMETQPYWFGTGSSTNTGANNVGVSRIVPDALGRPLRVYTADAQATNQSDVEFGSASFNGFGAYGKRKAALTSFAYAGGKTTITDDLGHRRIEEKNPIGEIVRTTDAYGAQLALQYDAFGNLRSTRDPLGNLTYIGVDYRGRKILLNDRDTGITNYHYNALGELVWQQNPVQRAKTPTATATTFAYDKLGRKASQVDDEYTSTWTYDAAAGNSTCLAGMLCESNTSHGVRKRYWYDAFGRPLSERMDVAGGVSLAQSRSWDATNGRLVNRTFPSGLRVGYVYTSVLSYLSQIKLTAAATIKPLPDKAGGTPPADVAWAAGKVVWRAMAVNAWGKHEAFGSSELGADNNLNTLITYDAYAGRDVKRVVGGLNTSGAQKTDVLNLETNWDSLGRLTRRVDKNGNANNGDDVEDTFFYDNINRLVQYKVAGTDVPGLQRDVVLTYNALGMLLKRSDVGSYTYPTVVDGQTIHRPHAVQHLDDLAGAGTDYFWDANGNLLTATAGKYRQIRYTSFNQPSSDEGVRGPGSNPKHTWQYDEAHTRIKETLQITSGTQAGVQTTWRWHPDNAGGLGYEYEINQPTVASDSNPATQQRRHYLSAAGQVVAVLVTDAVRPDLEDSARAPTYWSTDLVLRKVEGWHVDHLGSVITTTDHRGYTRQRYAYDPWGQRREAGGAADPGQLLGYDWSLATSAGTANGFTGHQHLDDVGLVHMNGRLYDPRLGVFMQADPLVQAMFDLQSYNRYGYCMASPMACMDPSGYSWLSKTWKKLWHSKVFRVVVATVAAVYTGGATWEYLAFSGAGSTASLLGAAAVGGFSAGAISSGNLEGGLQGAISGVIFFGVGEYLGGSGAFTGGAAPGEYSLTGVALHGVAGCVTSVMAGAKCGPGALSAAFSQATLPLKSGLDTVSGSLVSAAIGGTASVLGGGKFANGAYTASFGYLFNCSLHPGACKKEEIDSKVANCRGSKCYREAVLDYEEAGLMRGPDMAQSLTDFADITTLPARILTPAGRLLDTGIDMLSASRSAIDGTSGWISTVSGEAYEMLVERALKPLNTGLASQAAARATELAGRAAAISGKVFEAIVGGAAKEKK
jgi:RHS repeat-associated protein